MEQSRPKNFYQLVKAHPKYGEQVLNKLLTDPISLLDRGQIRQWLNITNMEQDTTETLDHRTAKEAPQNTLNIPDNEVPTLSKWINVLSPIEKAILYYTVATVKYNKRFNRKAWGPVTPVAGGLAATGLAGASIAVGTVGGAGVGVFGGGAVTAAAAEEIDSGVGTGVMVCIGGPILTVGGGFLGGCTGAVAGSVVALPLLGLAAKDFTWGVAKSIVLWPTTPFDKLRKQNLTVIRQMLREFSQLLDKDGRFNDKYEQVIENPNKLGPALYSFYLEFVGKNGNKATSPLLNLHEELVHFLAAFKNVVSQQSLIPGGQVYRKLKHIRNLIKLDMGIPEKTYAQICSNMGPSFVDVWVREWETAYSNLQKRQDTSTTGKLQHNARKLNKLNY